MNRRTFLGHTGLLATYGLTGGFSYSLSSVKDPMQRIGMSTVLFRNRFEQTRDEDMDSPSLTLLETPAFFADRYGLQNVEFWSLHFESIRPGYLNKLKASIKASGSRLINIQCDEKYDISDPDRKSREASMKLVMKWLEVAEALGSPAIRINPGEGRLEFAIESYRIINKEAKKKGLVLMVENHFGLATDPVNHIRMIKEGGPDNMYTLPDYGNYPDEMDRYAALEKVMPMAYQVSAKVTDFNEKGEHIGFDFGRCMEIAEASGFQGIYSVEQWSGEHSPLSDEAMGDWLVSRVKQHLLEK